MFHVKHDFREIEKIIAQTAGWGFGLTSERASLLMEYGLFLGSYEGSNVVGTRLIEEIVEDHVLDSMSCMLFEPTRKANELVDIGSGGGLPGLPLAITRGDLKVSLVESTAKKAKFLNEAVDHLSVTNAQIVNARAEDVGKSRKHRGLYDVATARALASLDVLAEYCLPLVRLGGYVIAMKAPVEKDELDRGRTAAELLGGEVVDVIPVERLPDYEQKQRNLVVFEKTSKTPDKYPRRVGLPVKKPLSETGNR